MKKLRIFALPSHASKERTSGVDFARIIQPMQHLHGYKLGDIEFEVRLYDPNKDGPEFSWLEVVPNYDLIYFNYTVNPWAFAHMGSVARKYKKPLVLDLDDSLWHVVEDNPSYNVYKKGSEGIKNFTAICNEVDAITCTNSYLKNIITHETRKSHNQIKVFDNYIDLDLYNHRFEFKDTSEIVLTHFGSTTHFIDLQNKEFVEGIDQVMKRYPNVRFRTVGAMVPEFKRSWGQRYENSYGDVDVYKWIKEKFPVFMEETDICVVPLEDNIYTRAKSAIKFLEMSSAAKPGAWQSIRQYQRVVEPGVSGFLASRANEWFEAISKLVEDKELRREMGQNAFNTVSENYQMKDNIKQYAEFFAGLV